MSFHMQEAWSWLPALSGGILIGIAATLMLWLNGRVTGVSGILGGFVTFGENRLWQGAFLAGLLTGGGILAWLRPEVFTNLSDRSIAAVAVAGLLVGFGTTMGGGCTSGHGVCGVSRMSVRSLVATAVFMAFGFIVVAAVRFLAGGSL